MTRLSCRSDGDCAQVSDRNRPSMHPTISFHVPGGFCGSSIDSLPRIYESYVDENDVRSKCRRSSGCIGYAFHGYSYGSYIYFSSSSAADNAADSGWYRLSSSCSDYCSINDYRFTSFYTCHRKTQTTTTEPRRTTIYTTAGAYVCVLIYTTRWVVKEIANGF